MKLATVVRHSLNGDADQVDPAVRRTLYAMANELDEQSDQWDERIIDLTGSISDAATKFSREVHSLRRLLVTLTTTVIGGIVVGIVNIAITL